MIQRYSFTKAPFQVLFDHISLFFPGILKIMAIYYDDNNELLLARSCSKEAGKYSVDEIDISESRVLVQKLRSKRIPYSWMDQPELSFEIIKGKQNQFNEINLYTLKLY